MRRGAIGAQEVTEPPPVCLGRCDDARVDHVIELTLKRRVDVRIAHAVGEVARHHRIGRHPLRDAVVGGRREPFSEEELMRCGFPNQELRAKWQIHD